MALEATFRELTACFEQVHEAVNALQITTEDKPEHDEAAVADDLSDKTLELLGMVHDARRAAVKAQQALKHPPDMDQARRALAQCQERFHRIEQKFLLNLVSYEKLKELVRIGGRGPEWAAWANGTKQGIEQCRDPIARASQALARCWQEMLEHSGTISISVKNMGQKIVARNRLTDKAVREQMT